MKFFNLPDYIDHIEFDGDKTDLRLHSDEHFSFGAKAKSTYEKATKAIEKISYKGNGWEIYASYDVSSFEYWMVKQQEQNHIGITISFDSEDIDESEISEIENAHCKAIADCACIQSKYSYDPCVYNK